MNCYECPDNALSSGRCYDCREYTSQDIKHNWMIVVILMVLLSVVGGLVLWVV
jgi:hypothetical protein